MRVKRPRRALAVGARRHACAGLLACALVLVPGAAAPAEAPAPQAVQPAPVIVRDVEAGHWLYESAALRVEIYRRWDPETPLIWYEADLRCSPAAPLRCVLSAEKYPAKHMRRPDAIARQEGLIYAQTDDFFGDRAGSRKLKPGVIVRNGKLLFDSVYHGGGKPFPPLDALAVFPDGSLETFGAREYTGEQYLAMGALEVVSFGPILIRDGVMDARLETGYADHEPRSAIGMIEPWHYFAVVAEGRHDGSRGCGLRRIAQRMLEAGVTEALNLDGGQTAAMLFLGTQLNRTGKFAHNTSVRSVSGVFGLKEPAAE